MQRRAPRQQSDWYRGNEALILLAPEQAVSQGVALALPETLKASVPILIKTWYRSWGQVTYKDEN